MDIHCTRCEALVPADRVDVERATAECAACGELSEVSNQLPGALRKRARARRRAAPAPGFRIQRIARSQAVEDAVFRASTLVVRDDLVVEWPWSRNRGIGVKTTIPLTITAGIVTGLFAPAALAGAIAVGGAATVYFAACWLLDRTRLTVTADVIELRHGPLPVPGGWRLRTDEIRQLFVECLHVGDDEEGPVLEYTLTVLDRGGRTRRLIRFDEQAEADLLERTLEELLGIPDVPVAGELPPAGHR